MGVATRIGVAAAAVLTSGGLLFFGTLDGASAHGSDGASRLIELPGCVARDHVPASAAVPAGGTMQQSITVTVLATTILRIDAHGHVTAATTNTGCAPRISDDVYVWEIDGSLSLASSKDVVRRAWTGDFTQPGVYVTQRS
ncbi:MAG: hypothetical protein JWL72_4255 [Ilumatobacteraceae bacterium]|nr:hypothetical protein [Ilumatobacteraceae bacterium]MCU1390917.1 hypothetical protein [Ilumatobacteraceae bacterium]